MSAIQNSKSSLVLFVALCAMMVAAAYYVILAEQRPRVATVYLKGECLSQVFSPDESVDDCTLTGELDRNFLTGDYELRQSDGSTIIFREGQFSAISWKVDDQG